MSLFCVLFFICVLLCVGVDGLISIFDITIPGEDDALVGGTSCLYGAVLSGVALSLRSLC